MKWHRREALKKRLTPGQVAQICGVDRHTVHNWIERGWISARYADGTTARISRLALKRALKRPEVKSLVVKRQLRAWAKATKRSGGETGD